MSTTKLTKIEVLFPRQRIAYGWTNIVNREIIMGDDRMHYISGRKIFSPAGGRFLTDGIVDNDDNK
jgi:hypothetical protein